MEAEKMKDYKKNTKIEIKDYSIVEKREFIGVWGGYEVTKDLSTNTFIVEETGKNFSTKEECFHKCIVGDVYD